MAIILSGLPVCAEEQSPVLSTSPNTALELNTLLNSDPSSKNHTPENSDKDLGEAVLVKESYPASTQSLTPGSKGPVHAAPTPKHTAPSSVASSTASDSIEPIEEPTKPSEPLFDPGSNNGWQFSVEPYFFVPLGVQGDVTVAGRSASIDLGLDDVLNLDRAFDAGLRLEAQHDRLGLILDAFYVSAAQSGSAGVTLPEGSLQRFGINTAARVEGDASISVDELTIDTAVSYRVIDTVLGNSVASSTPYPRLVVAPILGLRTRALWQELEVDTVRIGEISLPVDREFRSSRTTIEPLIGTQIGLDLSERWAISFRGDVSGFNINAEQDFTWNLLISTQYHLSRNLSLRLAYRFNGFDFTNGEGIRRTRLNLYQNGIWLSGIFRF